MPKPPLCPFVGLIPFEEEDWRYFFGRDAEGIQILTNLLGRRLTLLYGPSGVGKSSLLQALVVDRISKLDLLPDEPRAVPIVFNSWSEAPATALAVRIGEALNIPGGAAITGETLATFTRNAVRSAGAHLYLILDQFEEFFLYQPVRHVRHSPLLMALVEMIRDPQTAANIIFSLREDGLARLDIFKPELPSIYDNSLRLDYLPIPSARKAINEPLRRFTGDVRRGEYAVEPELEDELLRQIQVGQVMVSEAAQGRAEDSTSDLIETPYLQLVLSRIWEEETIGAWSKLALTEKHWMHAKTLRDLGGAEGIVRTHLHRLLDEKLDDAERAIMAALARYLVTPDQGKVAQSQATLRQYTESMLNPEQQTGIGPLLEKLASRDFYVLRRVNLPSGARYEVFHDTLGKALINWQVAYDRQRAEVEAARKEKERQDKDEADRLRRLEELKREEAHQAELTQARTEAAKQADFLRLQAENARKEAETSHLRAIDALEEAAAATKAEEVLRSQAEQEKGEAEKRVQALRLKFKITLVLLFGIIALSIGFVGWSIPALQSKLRTLEREQRTLQDNTSGLTIQKGDLEQKLLGLQTTFAEAQKDDAVARQEIEKQRQELKEKNQLLENRGKELENEIQKRDSKNQELEAQNSKLTGQNNELADKNAKLADQIALVSKQNQEFQQEKTKLAAAIRDLRDKLLKNRTSLPQKTVQDLLDALANLENLADSSASQLVKSSQDLSTVTNIIGPLGWRTGKAEQWGGQSGAGKFGDSLALISTWKQADATGVFRPKPANISKPPTAADLDDTKFYLAARWDYTKTPPGWLLKHKVKVRNPSNPTLILEAQPVEWGPPEKTPELMAISPGLATALHVKRDDDVSYLDPGSEMTPVLYDVVAKAPTVIPKIKDHHTQSVPLMPNLYIWVGKITHRGLLRLPCRVFTSTAKPDSAYEDSKVDAKLAALPGTTVLKSGLIGKDSPLAFTYKEKQYELEVNRLETGWDVSDGADLWLTEK